MEDIKLIYNDIYIKDKLLLKKGNIKIKRNKINLIQGKNGLGKSLFLSLIHFQNELNTVLMSQVSSEKINHLSILDNITLTTKNNLKNKKVLLLLEKFGIKNKLMTKSTKLSGGESRTLSLIRALSSDAEIILLDEPTNDLDFRKVNILVEIIKEFTEHKTVIIISHDDRLVPIADEIFKIENNFFKVEKDRITNESDSSYETINLLQKHRSKKDFLNVLNSFLFIQFGFSFYKSKVGLNNFKKIFRFNFMPLVVVFASLYFNTMIINDALTNETQIFELINDNQVDIFSPLTRYFSVTEQALPLSLIDWFLHLESLPTRKELELLIEDILNETINLEVQIPDTDKIKVIPMEFWKHYTRTFLDPVLFYIDHHLQLILGEVDINTEQFFKGNWLFNFSSVNIYQHQIDLEILDDMTQLMLDKEKSVDDDITLTYAVILLEENMSFNEFISYLSVNNVPMNGLLVRSNFTISLINEIILFDLLKELRQMSILISIIFNIILFFNSSVLIKNSVSNIKKLRDYGIEIEIVRQTILKKHSSLPILLLSIGISAIHNLFLVFGSELKEYYLIFIPSILISTTLLINYFYYRYLSYFYLKHLYKWNSR